MPRSFAEIKSDVDKAVRNDNAEQLAALIQELDADAHDPKYSLLKVFSSAVHLFLLGRMDESVSTYKTALSQARSIGESRLETIIIGNTANVYQVTGRYTEAIPLYIEVLELHEKRGELRDAARVLSNLSSAAAAVGNMTEARIHAGRSMELFSALNDEEGKARSMYLMGMIEDHEGNQEGAILHLRAARDAFESIGNSFMTLRCDMRVSSVLFSTGSTTEAYEGLMRALHESINLSAVFEESEIRGHLSSILSTHADFAGAIEQNEKALVALAGKNVPFVEAEHENIIGVTYQRAGDYAQARIHLTRAQDRLGEDGPLHTRANVICNLAELASEEKRFDEAVMLFRQGVSMAQQLGRSQLLSLMKANLAHALLDNGNVDEASEVIAEIDGMEIRECSSNILHQHARAKLHKHRGNLVAAREHAERSLALAESCSIPNLAAVAHEFLRDIAKQEMDFDGYIRHSEAAQKITNNIKGAEVARQLEFRKAEQAVAFERAETERHRALLYSTLPPAIADRVLRGESVNDAFTAVAVMFMDLVGFTTMSSSMSPDNVVKLLHELFSACDSIVAKNNVMKIKTIGDSYMAAAFPTVIQPEESSQCAVRIARAAIDILQSVRELAIGAPLPNSLLVRIGIHIGPATAGVIGTERMQYDVWGDTVNVASRMESTGEPGRIQVSQAMADALQGAPYRLVERGTITVKGKGEMTTYWLEGAQP